MDRSLLLLLLPFLSVALVFLMWLPLKVAIAYGEDGETVAVDASKVSYSGPSPGSDASELMVLMHVSDIHISRFNATPAEQFQFFCEEVVPAVSPRAVLATGDLTDGYSRDDRLAGGQQLEEWETYRSILNASGLLSLPTAQFEWLDMRGNHDTYGTGTIGDSSDLFEQFGLNSATNRGRTDKRVWSTDLPLAGTASTLRVVGLDANVSPGIALPFNFYGTLSSDAQAAVAQHITAGGANSVTNALLVGHHPDSQILGGLGSDVRELVPYYLTGHLHSETMNLRLGSMIELEVDDMLNDQAWRLMALDHGQVSFRDQTLDGFPFGLVTNPKDARFLSSAEPNHAANSTHVRILAYSDVAIASVAVTLEGETTPTLATEHPTTGGLFLLPWTPPTGASATGVHSMRVTITDADGKSESFDHHFSLDGSTVAFGSSGSQVRQAAGDNVLYFRVTLALVTLSNAAIIWAHRGALDLTSSAQRRIGAFVALSFVELSVGPYMIGFFINSDAPLVFLFPYGAAVVGQGFAVDGMVILFALLLQGIVIYPFLAFLALHARAVGFDGVGTFDKRALLAHLRWPEASTTTSADSDSGCGRVAASLATGARLLLPYYVVLVAVVVPPGLMLSLFGSVVPVLLSPAAWVIVGYVVTVCVVLGTPVSSTSKVANNKLDV